MTPFHLLRIGDNVVVECASNMRFQNDVLVGTTGIVCGFNDEVIFVGRTHVDTLPHGVYQTRKSVSILLLNGLVVNDIRHVRMVNEDEEENRRSSVMSDESVELLTGHLRISDLPSTRLWEQDRVRINDPEFHDKDPFIYSINFSNINRRYSDGSQYPVYQIGNPESAIITDGIQSSLIELVNRGNVWKYYNDEPLSFDDLNEEARFFTTIGHTEKVQNPNTDDTNWLLNDALMAIREGTAHGFTRGLLRLSPDSKTSLRRYRDKDLGRRVANATLQMHNDV